MCGYEYSSITGPSNDHSVYTLSYETFVVPLVKAIQEQQVIIEKQKDEISEIRTEIDQLMQLISTQVKANDLLQKQIKECMAHLSQNPIK